MKSDIDKIDDFLFEMNEPKVFWGAKGVEVNFIKSFESTCTLINQHISRDSKKMTVLEYYETLSILRQQFKKKK